MNIDWQTATDHALARVRYTPGLRALGDWEQQLEVDIFALYRAIVDSPLAPHAAEFLNRLSRIENAAYMIGHKQGQKDMLPW